MHFCQTTRPITKFGTLTNFFLACFALTNAITDGILPGDCSEIRSHLKK